MPRCSIWKASSTSDPYLALSARKHDGITIVGRRQGGVQRRGLKVDVDLHTTNTCILRTFIQQYLSGNRENYTRRMRLLQRSQKRYKALLRFAATNLTETHTFRNRMRSQDPKQQWYLSKGFSDLMPHDLSTFFHHIAQGGSEPHHWRRANTNNTTQKHVATAGVVVLAVITAVQPGRGTHKAFATAEAHSHQDFRIALTRWCTSADAIENRWTQRGKEAKAAAAVATKV